MRGMPDETGESVVSQNLNEHAQQPGGSMTERLATIGYERSNINWPRTIVALPRTVVAL